MKRVSADTNLFIYAADPGSQFHSQSLEFFESHAEASKEFEFVVCELVLVELYMQLRNPAVFRKPYSSSEAGEYCLALKSNPQWRCVDYERSVSVKLWEWAAKTKKGFRTVIDARLGFTLRHHGVTHFATANKKDFAEFGFERVWNPLVEK
jgi:uncharacterized protein